MMKLFVSAILMACVIALNGQPMKEESKDVVSADSAAEYLFEKSPMTWGQADARCKRWGGRLVTVKNAAQNAYILKELKRRGMKQSWTGLNDNAHEGKFVWLYGNTCSHYKNWHHGEPNGKRSENCMELIPQWNGHWNDVSCNARRTSVCHKVGGGNGCGGGHAHHHGGQWVMTKEVVYYKDPVSPVSTESTTELSADEKSEGLDEKDVHDESNDAPEEEEQEEDSEDAPEEESDAPEEDVEEEEVEDEE